jgi:NAD(P)-dependent dehydrogenase (short-subunit alcohol dehydrogenase family)
MNRRTALITGAGKGIGAATVRSFALAGWDVIAVDLEEPAVPSTGSEHRSMAVDLSQSAEIERLLSRLESCGQPVSALVNNAGVQVAGSLQETTDADWDLVMRVNVRAAFLLARGLAGTMGNGAGAIVNVASVHAISTSRSMAAYATSKGALVALTRVLALELAPSGIRVNAVLPGAVETDMLKAGLARGHVGGESVPEKLAHLARRTPIGRVGQPEEIAEAVLFLADESRSSFITGQTLVVDGGALCALSTETTS